MRETEPLTDLAAFEQLLRRVRVMGPEEIWDEADLERLVVSLRVVPRVQKS
jgi:hypothetical protein